MEDLNFQTFVDLEVRYSSCSRISILISTETTLYGTQLKLKKICSRFLLADLNFSLSFIAW